MRKEQTRVKRKEEKARENNYMQGQEGKAEKERKKETTNKD